MYKGLFVLGLSVVLGMFLASTLVVTVHAIDRGGVDLDRAQKIRGKNVQRSVGNFRQTRRVKRTSVDYKNIQKRLAKLREERKKARENRTYDPSAETNEKELKIDRGGLEAGRIMRKRPNFSIRSTIKRTNQDTSTRGRHRRTRPGAADRTYRRKAANNANARIRRNTRRISAGDSYKKSKRRQRVSGLRDTRRQKFNRQNY